MRLLERFGAALIGVALTGTLVGPAAAQSQYGCRDLAGSQYLASVEGRDGVFFRISPDLSNMHPMTPETVADLAELSQALAAKGTALIYAPVPTKPLALPRYLSPEAMDFGFDYSLATTVYLDDLGKLHEAGVRAVDLRAEMAPANAPLSFFRADPRLNAAGAQLAARAIARAIAAVPGIEALARNRFQTRPTGSANVESHSRLVRQQYCAEPLPEATTETFATTRASTGDGPQGVIALVGSAHSDTPEANFAGFLAEETGIQVIQYSVPGGGAFAAISTYLTSAEFQQARPSIIVWELPLAEAPGLSDDQRMLELIAAARGSCDLGLTVSREGGSRDRVNADLSSISDQHDKILFIDADGAQARRAVFTWHDNQGRSRSREITRHPAQLPTGRFYVPMSGLWPEGARNVTVTLDATLGDNTEMRLCSR